jgi:hypothetical protein
MCYIVLHSMVDTDIVRAIGYSPYNFTCGNSLKLAEHTVATVKEKNFVANCDYFEFIARFYCFDIFGF